jgi:hypothetical protein
MEQFYILKQFYPGAEIWVAKLNEEDTKYTYPTLGEAEEALPTVQALYPDNLCKVSGVVSVAE